MDQDGPPFSGVPSAASVQRYRHSKLSPKTTAPAVSSPSRPRRRAHSISWEAYGMGDLSRVVLQLNRIAGPAIG